MVLADAKYRLYGWTRPILKADSLSIFSASASAPRADLTYPNNCGEGGHRYHERILRPVHRKLLDDKLQQPIRCQRLVRRAAIGAWWRAVSTKTSIKH